MIISFFVSCCSDTFVICTICQTEVRSVFLCSLSDEDIHKCGRCLEEFSALDAFIQHKLSRSCKRPQQDRQVCVLLYNRIIKYPESFTVQMCYSSKNPENMYQVYHKNVKEHAKLIIINVS